MLGFLLLDDHATRGFVVYCLLEFLGNCFGVGRCDTSNENTVTLFENFRGNFDDLRWCFAGTINDFWEALPQSTMLVNLCEAKVGDRFFAQRGESLCLADFAGAEIFKQLSCLGRGHAGKYAELTDFLQQKR